MRLNFGWLFLLFLLFFTCSKRGSESFGLVQQIKTLEFTREPDAQKWQTLYQSLPNDANLLKTFVLSAGQTRNSALFPLLKQIFHHSLSAKDDSLFTLCVFSLTQVAPSESESLFLNYLENDSLSSAQRPKLIQALGYCGGRKSLPLLAKLAQERSFRSYAYYALGLLAKKHVYDDSTRFNFTDSTRTAPPSVDEAFYLYQIPFTPSLLKKVVEWLPRSKAKVKSLLLKKLAKEDGLATLLARDSLRAQTLKRALFGVLAKQNRSSHLLLPALKLAAFFADSVTFSKVQPFIRTGTPAVQVQAAQTLLRLNRQKALPLLTKRIAELPYTAQRAFLIKTLTSADPSLGYLLINQNLDKGSAHFRAILLEALGQTRIPLAMKMLRRFLSVDDPVIIQGALNALEKAHALTPGILRPLLQNKHYPVVAMAVDWYARHDKAPQKDLLFHLYKTFRSPGNCEIQLSVAKLLKEHYSLTSAESDTLRKYLAHPFLQKSLAQILGQNLEPRPASLALFPAFLQPDSLMASDSLPIVRIKTSKGSFRVRLFANVAPLTVKNFLHLAQSHFYDHLVFHRVVPDFVVQGGDPTGTGWGGTNYLIPSEHSPYPFKRGTVGIATAGFDTGSCQFFICLSDQPHLNGNYTAFGRVIDSMNVVENLEIGDTIIHIKRIE